MAPATHAFIGWWTANVLPLSRRDRLVIFLAGVLPDLDGLTMLYGYDTYTKYHHVLSHNLLAGVAWTGVATLFAQQRRTCAVLAFLNWHLHLACDYFGSGGADGTTWVLPYLFPFVGSWPEGSPTLVGPTWYRNPWQWPLSAWPNLLVTLLTGIGWVYIAVRLDRSWFEFIWPRMDQELCRTLRKWFGSQPAVHWSEREGKVIWRSFVAVTSLALLACVVAASRAAAPPAALGVHDTRPRAEVTRSFFDKKARYSVRRLLQ